MTPESSRFGSGWAWLVEERRQDRNHLAPPTRTTRHVRALFPILGNDVWEHAYYLKYNNRRPEYLAAWWNVVNWDEINKRYDTFKSGK